jgi:hypothetical protein
MGVLSCAYLSFTCYVHDVSQSEGCLRVVTNCLKHHENTLACESQIWAVMTIAGLDSTAAQTFATNVKALR